MYKLLIIDDDEIMLEGIRKNINWEEQGIEVVGTASNGRDGIEMLRKNIPDVVLSDIKMPFMDGLMMAEYIHNYYPEIKIVLLTGHDDFIYAKKAIQLRIFEYILKYEDNDVILSSVVRACTEFERERSNIERISRGINSMKDNFFIDLISGRFTESDIIKLETLNFNFNDNNSSVAIVVFDEIQSEDLDKYLDSMKDKLKELLKNYGDEGFSIVYKAAIVLILNCLNIEKIYDNIKTISEFPVTIGVGSLFEGYQNINISYKEAIMCIEMKNILDRHKIIYIENIRNNPNSHKLILKRIQNYINKNSFNEDISLNQIAEEVHISPTYVSTLFKKYMKINFNDYLTNIRITKAKELLINTDMKTYEISDKVGYSNPQYFSVLFKKHTGCSPTEYRQIEK